MMSADALAQALAELAYQVYRGRKPPANVLKAFGVIVALATEAKAVKASEAKAVKPHGKRPRINPKRHPLNGHGGGAHEEGRAT